jgi:hypothetical protein
MDTEIHYHEMAEALGQPGCPVCRLVAQSAERYLDSVLWELVNDTDVRSELNQARGYCQQHAWLLVRAGAALGVAILMQDIVKTLLETIDTNPVQEISDSVLKGLLQSLEKKPSCKATAKLTAALAPQLPCPVCSHVQVREKEFVRTVLAHLDGPWQMEAAFRASDGLCLAHFREALARASSENEAKAVLAVQREIWERLHAELGEFIRKTDHRFRNEPYGAERDAWRRALEAISGPPPRSRSMHQGMT